MIIHAMSMINLCSVRIMNAMQPSAATRRHTLVVRHPTNTPSPPAHDVCAANVARGAELDCILGHADLHCAQLGRAQAAGLQGDVRVMGQACQRGGAPLCSTASPTAMATGATSKSKSSRTGVADGGQVLDYPLELGGGQLHGGIVLGLGDAQVLAAQVWEAVHSMSDFNVHWARWHRTHPQECPGARCRMAVQQQDVLGMLCACPWQGTPANHPHDRAAEPHYSSFPPCPLPALAPASLS